MLVIQLLGLPHQLQDAEALSQLARQDLPVAVASIRGLDVAVTEVCVFSPKDLLSVGLGKEVVVIIDGLFRHNRVLGAREDVASAVLHVVRGFVERHIPQCDRVLVVSHVHDRNYAEHWQRSDDDDFAGIDLELLNMPVREFLGTTSRLINFLARTQVDTVRDLLRRSEADLLSITHFGPGMLQVVKDRLAEQGLSLKPKKGQVGH